MIAELKALTEIAGVLKVAAPLFTKKKDNRPEEKPTVVGGESIRDNFEPHEVREFDLKRTLITLVVGALMAFGVSKGWITPQEADLVDDIIVEKVDEATD
jgi:hypothetical protein